MGDSGGSTSGEPGLERPDLPAGVDPDATDVVTVTELSRELESLVDRTEGVHHDYVLGDVANPSQSASGHLYFTLEGEDCELQCVAFGFRRAQLSTDPDDGTRVLVAGDLQYYPPRSQVSLQVTDCHAVGEGEYAQVYRQTEAQLDADGLLGDAHTQPLPTLPETIGLVTSTHGDAVDDAIESIHDRYPGIDISVAHTGVQGDDAVANIVATVERLDADPAVDLIVVTRGGGADSTLRTFNELAVCRTIARTDTPIAVGIGHESDETLAGRVADERISTPTDAGSLVPDRDVLTERVESLGDRLETAYESRVTDRLAALADRQQAAYEQSVATRLRQLRYDLDAAATRAMQARLGGLEADLAAAYEAKRRTAAVEREAASARRLNRALLAAVAALLVLLAVLVVTFVL